MRKRQQPKCPAARSAALRALCEQATIRRFWRKVWPKGDCWEWRGTKAGNGYGVFHVRGKRIPAHRYAYELAGGRFLPGEVSDHLCSHPLCVRPSHLIPATNRENVLRGSGPTAVNARLTHCPQGHPYDAKNTWVDKERTRHCRKCMRASLYRWRAAKRLVRRGAA